MKKDIALYRSTQIIWYALYVVEGLLFLRFFMRLLGANQNATFTELIYSLSAVPLAPFTYVFSPNYVGNNVFEWSTLLAIAVYWLIAGALIKLVSMGRTVEAGEVESNLRTQENI